MKVTVILEKEARICAQLSTNDAVEAFEKMADILIGGIEKGVKRGQPVTAVLKPAEIEKAPEIKKDSEEQHTGDKIKIVGRRLVIMKCPGCGSIVPCLVQEGQETITCRHCQENVPIEGLVPANYTCPNCSYKANFYVLGNLQSVRCKNCESDIDLIYHEKKHCYLSANLIK